MLAPDDLLHQHLLARVPLTEADFRFFHGYLKPRTLARGQHLLRAGEVCQHLAFVLNGYLHSYSVDEKGQAHTLQFSPPGWWVSDLSSFLTGQPSMTNIDAREKASQVLLLHQNDLETIYQRCPLFERYFRLLMQSRYVALQARVDADLSKTALQRYEQFGRQYPELMQRVPQHLIASYLGITPESLSRVRRQVRPGR